MRPLLRVTLSVVLAISIASSAFAPVQADVNEGSMRAEAFQAAVRYVETVIYIGQVAVALAVEYVEWVGQEEARIAQEARDAAAKANAGRSTSPTPRNVSRGTITQEQFAALAICEHGGTNGSLYGYYSIMDPRAGSLSMAEQQAWAQDIYNRVGASAWSGCAYNLGG